MLPVKSWSIAAAVVWAMVALNGCGERPPECGQPEAVALAKDVVKNEIKSKALAAATRGAPPDVAAAWAKIVDRYISAVNVQVSEIVSNGHDANARKRSCEAKFTITTPAPDTATVRSAYSTQMTEDKKGSFLLSVDEAGKIAIGMLGDFQMFAQKEAMQEMQAQAAAAAARSPTPAQRPTL